MKERDINFKTNDDKTLVVFEEKNKKDLLKEINDLQFALTTLKINIQDDKLDEGFKCTLASLSESHLSKILTNLDYNSYLEKEKEERYSQIRAVNNENRELRKQLGEKVTNEDIREGVKLMEESIRHWWNTEGLGHVQEITFKRHGIEVKLSADVTDRYYDDTNIDAKDRLQRFKDMGFTFHKKTLLDTPENFELLKKMVYEKFPSANIYEYKVWCGRKEDSQIRDIEMQISNFDDVIFKK